MNKVTIALVGSGGSGVAALGDMLLAAAGKQGYYGMLRKAVGPQIRGGESAAIVRLGTEPVANFCGEVDLLVALDWSNFDRFYDEIPVTESTLIIQDGNAGEAPAPVSGPDRIIEMDFSGAARTSGSQHSNLALLGYLTGWLLCSESVINAAIRQRLSKQSDELIALAMEVAQKGAQLYLEKPIGLPPPELSDLTGKDQEPDAKWIATGNQLAGLGALEAGVRFVAAYPITPASDALEWIADHIESAGGHLIQAEDELAAVNMAIGAGFGGVPSFTATSGPGLALMSESMGLAVASETPLVILNVMRGGPSTGIPTKSEQSDFNLAVYGVHGDAPHLVLSTLSVEDCYQTTAWAVELASELQTLAVVLSDQFLGQSSQVMAPLPRTQNKTNLMQPDLIGLSRGGYCRYLDTGSGVTPMALPGQPCGMYTADGLEHSENAIPSSKSGDHLLQLEKRLRKLKQKDFGERWAETEGEGDVLLICWGSLYQVALEARQRLQARGHAIKIMGVRLLHPLPEAKLQQVLRNIKTVLVVEQNQQGQFAAYLRSLGFGDINLFSYSRPGPTLFTPAELTDKVEEVMAHEGQRL